MGARLIKDQLKQEFFPRRSKEPTLSESSRLFTLGNSKSKVGSYNEAIEAYDKALKLHANHNKYFYAIHESYFINRGKAKGKIGDHKGEKGDYLRAKEIFSFPSKTAQEIMTLSASNPSAKSGRL